jgi:hypothetical protein
VLHRHGELLLLLSCHWEASHWLWVLPHQRRRQMTALLLQLLLSVPLPAAAAWPGCQLSQSGTCWLCLPAGHSTRNHDVQQQSTFLQVLLDMQPSNHHVGTL